MLRTAGLRKMQAIQITDGMANTLHPPQRKQHPKRGKGKHAENPKNRSDVYTKNNQEFLLSENIEAWYGNSV